MNGPRTITWLNRLASVARKIVVFLVVCLVASLTATAPAWAAQGDLDMTFDGDGRILTDLRGASDSGEAVVVQPDGKIVLAGFAGRSTTPFTNDSLLLRYNPDGTLDTTFGSSGKVVVELSAPSRNDLIYDIALEPDGDIVAIGEYETDTAARRVLVARFEPSGNLDAGFGTGGVADTSSMGDSSGRGVALQDDGKIVITGSYLQDGVLAARFTSSGQLDDTFNADGWTYADFGSFADDQGEDVAIDGAGNIVAVGHFYGPNPIDRQGTTDMAVARFDPEGVLDSTFDGDGKKTLDFTTRASSGGVWDYSHDYARGVAIQPDDKIVIAGEVAGWEENTTDTGRDFTAIRLTPSGELDATFSGDGVGRTSFGTESGDYDRAHDLVTQRNGKIVLAGLADLATDDFGLVRYMPDGTLDPTFGSGGKVSTDFQSDSGSTGGSDVAHDVGLQDDGKIVAVGRGHTNQRDVAVARYLGDPTYSLSVTRDGSGSGRVASSPAGINCGSDCVEIFDGGSSVILTATPETGSIFSGWSGACTGTSDSCAVTMDAAKSVTATFAQLPDPMLTVASSGPGTVTSNPEGIDCGLDCTESYVPGTEVVLTAASSTDATFSGWTGACTGASGSCTLAMNGDKNVTATFVSHRRTLGVTTSGSGTVTSTPAGIDCGSDCTEDYAPGTTVVLNAIPAAGWVFSSWSDDCSGTSDSCTVTMDASRSVTAMFVGESSPPPSGGGGPSSTPEEDAAEQRAAGATCAEIADYLMERHDLDAAQLAAALNSVACSATEIAQEMQRLFGTPAGSAASNLAGLGFAPGPVASALKTVYQLDCGALATALRSGFDLSAPEMAVVLRVTGCDLTSIAGVLKGEYGLGVAENAALLLNLRLDSPLEIAKALVAVYPATTSEQITQILGSHNVSAEAVARVLDRVFNESASSSTALLYRYVTQDAAAIAKALKVVFNKSGQAIATLLHKARVRASAIAKALKVAFDAGAQKVAEWMYAAGINVDGIAKALKVVFDKTAEGVARALHKLHIAATRIAAGLKKVFNAGAERVAKIFKDLKMGAGKVALALKNAFGTTKQKIAALLDEAGYTLKQVGDGFVAAFNAGWDALLNLFLNLGVAFDKVIKILRQIFGV